MVFSSLPFLFGFLVVTMILYYSAPRYAKNPVLFVMSLLFYGYGEPVYILLMLFSILMNYVCGLLMNKVEKRKLVLIVCIILNVGLLGFFKYAGLAVETLKLLPVFSFLPNPEIALPIGISFYTFQTMSYVIDVYRGNCEPQYSFVRFGTYVTLFPQLIAGPIVRYVDIEEQLDNHPVTPELFSRGVRLFVLGLAKKVLLANQLGALWTELKASDSSGIIGSWVGIFAFTMQIYFDFSGYSDMACGLGNMFGFSFVKNFDYPYTSNSITEFWRRWHISLGTWFREYVYIPLGGNRKGKARQLVNIFIVWALTGIWHGASWNFLLWGLYFGILLTVEKLFLLDKLKKVPSFISRIYTFFFVVLGWVIFDFTQIGEMGTFFGKLFSVSNGIASSDSRYLIISYLPLLIFSAIACSPVIKKLYHTLSEREYIFIFEAVAVLIILILCVASLVNSTYNPFLYFRF